MRSLITTGFIAMVILLSPAGTAKDQAVIADDPPLYVDGSLCARPDKIVFSCPLDKSKKIVSICAAGGSSPHRFYYAFGKPGAPKLVYPDKISDITESLFITRLEDAATPRGAGDAFSFLRNGVKYIAYNMTWGDAKVWYRKAGVLVQRPDTHATTLDLSCRKEKIVDLSTGSHTINSSEKIDGNLLEEILDAEGVLSNDKYKTDPHIDPEIAKHGLPINPRKGK